MSSLPEVDYNSFDEAVEIVDSIQQLRQEVREEVIARKLQSEASTGCLSSCSCYKFWKIVFLTSLICLIWLAMAVPSVLYIVEVVGYVMYYSCN